MLFRRRPYQLRAQKTGVSRTALFDSRVKTGANLSRSRRFSLVKIGHSTQMQLEMPLRLLLLFYFTQAALGAQSAAPWTLESTGPWAPREGLMVAKLKEKLYLTGGRGTHGVGFSNEVWSSNNGSGWERVTRHAPWGRRAYHILLETHDGCLALMGGQVIIAFLAHTRIIDQH